MRPGEYKNRAGAILHLIAPFVGTHRVKTLGLIYEAEARDPLFGITTYLVTEESMRESGYSMAVPDSDGSGS